LGRWTPRCSTTPSPARDSVIQLIAGVRRVGRELPGVGAVIAAECLAHDYTDPGKPAIAWDGLALGDALVGALVTDAGRLLTRLEVGADEAKAAEALAWLALVAGQCTDEVGASR
jgi:hypothetical protein